MTRSSWTTRSHAFAGCIQSGTGFPDGRALGKSVPEFGFGMGCSFRLRGLAENASRNLQSEWDEVSQRSHKRKLHPTPNANCGTRFPDAKKPHDVAFNLYICCGYPPLTSRAPTTGRLSGRQNIRFIASSARKGGRLMWPPLRRTVRAGNLICLRPDRRFSYELAASRYLILVVPGARLGSVSLASVWKCSVYTFLPSRNIS